MKINYVKFQILGGVIFDLLILIVKLIACQGMHSNLHVYVLLVSLPTKIFYSIFSHK